MSQTETRFPPVSTDVNADSSRRSAGFILLIIALMTIGLASRITPLFNVNERLLTQFPTEDGYLMLQVARNMAIGNGMSIADGTIPTNGVQPLTTFLWAGCFKLAGGDKTAGVRYVHILQLLIGLAAAGVLYRLGCHVLKGTPRGRCVATLAVAVWYAGPLTAKNMHNCLETGTYAFIVLCTVWMVVAALREPDKAWSPARSIGIGAVLGIAFWTRNDATFLILAVCLWRVWTGRLSPAAFLQAFIVGITSIVVALPWLIFNVVRFDHLMPISGVAESLHAELGQNLRYLPAALTEYVLAVLPIPNHQETSTVVIVGGVICIAAMLGCLVAMVRRSNRGVRTLAWLVGLYALGLCVFYGAFFGVGHFVNRYMFPLSPFLALLWAGVAIVVCDRIRSQAAVVANALPILLVLLLAGLNARVYRSGDQHQHFAVVRWTQNHVAPETWVAAIQTGTLGFFHDRTINLDGKVNPEALEYRKDDRIPEYVVNVRPQIAYLIDWGSTIKTLYDSNPLLQKHFEMTHMAADRPRTGVGVMRRTPSS